MRYRSKGIYDVRRRFLYDGRDGTAKRSNRCLIAITGSLGSDKPTLAARPTDALNAQGRKTVLVPMDDFHLDTRVLSDMNRLAEKGTPDTFDSSGFLNAIQRLKSGKAVILQVFDRNRKLAIAGAIIVPKSHQTLVVGGIFCVSPNRPGIQLHSIWDISVNLDVARPELERRLVQRWLDQGGAKKAQHRTDVYDLPNSTASLVIV